MEVRFSCGLSSRGPSAASLASFCLERVASRPESTNATESEADRRARPRTRYFKLANQGGDRMARSLLGLFLTLFLWCHRHGEKPAGKRAGPGCRRRARSSATRRASPSCWLQGLIRINTTNPPGNEIAAAKYLAGILQKEGIHSEIFESAPGRGILIARLSANGAARIPRRALLLDGPSGHSWRGQIEMERRSVRRSRQGRTTSTAAAPSTTRG